MRAAIAAAGVELSMRNKGVCVVPPTALGVSDGTTRLGWGVSSVSLAGETATVLARMRKLSRKPARNNSYASEFFITNRLIVTGVKGAKPTMFPDPVKGGAVVNRT